jgi:anti-anti-sigma factor
LTNSNAAEMSSSKIGISRVGSRTVLTPKGSITYQNIEVLTTMFNECMSKNKTEIILDCKTVSFVDSESLEFILQMNEDLEKQGGKLKLINVNAICRDIFIVTRLVNILHIYEDIHKAIRSG